MILSIQPFFLFYSTRHNEIHNELHCLSIINRLPIFLSKRRNQGNVDLVRNLLSLTHTTMSRWKVKALESFKFWVSVNFLKCAKLSIKFSPQNFNKIGTWTTQVHLHVILPTLLRAEGRFFEQIIPGSKFILNFRSRQHMFGFKA